jgi:hypothetical protein
MTVFLFYDKSNQFLEEAFFAAVGAADHSATLRSRVFYGSLLVHSIAQRLVAGKRQALGTHYEYQFDKTVFKTLTLGLADALGSRKRSIDEEQLRLGLYSKELYCISLATCPRDIGVKVDVLLRESVRGYLGYVEPDLGSPVEYRLFVDMLISRKQIDGRTLYEAWPEPMHLPNDVPPYKRIAVLEGAYDEIADPSPAPGPPSAAGADLVARVRAAIARSNASLRSRVLTEAFAGGKDFAIEPLPESASRTHDDELTTEALRAKLALYALNPEHQVGKHKARVFASALGITVSDWLYLAAQIVRNAHCGKVHRIEQTTFGIKFTMLVDVVGLNDSVATVTTGWILKDDKVELTTAYVSDRPEPDGNDVPQSYRVAGTSETERYAGILALAHERGALAAKSTRPTPNLIDVGGKHYVTEELGTAYVHVKDARRGFARWLLRTGNGHRHLKGGAVVYANTTDQSIERAEAYSKAFAEVLRENEIQCEVEAISD